MGGTVRCPHWTPEETAELERLWATGIERNRIALAMGRSKQSVRQRAIRIGLLKPGGKRGPAKQKPEKPPELPRAGLVTLPPLPSLQGSSYQAD